MLRRGRLRSTSRAIERVGSALTDALMGPAGIVVVAVLVEDALKVVLAEDEEMIETLSSHRADQAFAVRVRLGRHHGRADHPDARALGDLVEDGSELGIVVAEEELRSLPERRQLPKLLGLASQHEEPRSWPRGASAWMPGA